LPFMIVGTAGSTNTGAIDSLDELAQIAGAEKTWFHVDGAYGGLFKLTEEGNEKLKGIEKADSVIFDPHKTMALPYGTGALIVRDGSTLKALETTTGTYMPPPIGEDDVGLQIDYSEITPELSRDFRGLRVWLPLKTFGVGPFKLNLEEKLRLANWFCSELKKIEGVEVVAEPQLSIFAIRLKEEYKTDELLVRMNKKGTLFLSSCKLDGKMALRFCFLGFRLHYDRLNQALAEMKEIIHELK
ncbi:MAG: aspartate aminotransferase family protein, partial [Pseudobdellovibrionaceae bacterium]